MKKIILFPVLLGALLLEPVRSQDLNKKTDSLLIEISKRKDNITLAKDYHNLCLVYFAKGDIENAEKIIHKHSALIKKTKTAALILEHYIMMQSLYTFKGDYNMAKKYATLTSQLAKKTNDMVKFLVAEMFYLTISIETAGENPKIIDASLQRINSSINYAAKSNLKDKNTYVQLGAAHKVTGGYYIKIKNYDSAIINLQKALEYYNQSKDVYGILSCYQSISATFMITKDWQSAKKYLLMINDKDLSQSNIILKMGNLAEVEKQLGNYNLALNYIEKGLNVAETSKNNKHIGQFLEVKALIYLEQKQYFKTIEACKTGLGSQLSNDSRIQLHLALTESYFALEDVKNAMFYNKKLIEMISPEMADTNTAFDNEVYYRMAEFQKNISNYKLASKYYKKYAKLNKEKYLNEKQDRLNELQTKFDVKDKDLKLKNLTIAKQKNELKMAKQKSTLYATLGILSITAIAGLFSYQRYRSNKKRNFMLQGKNREIETSLNQKNVLLKEIHHRVKNNLQLIISLLNIQARENNHSSVDAFLEKGRGRIISMALIHQNLYEADNLAKVNFHEYLQNLISSNAEAYRQEARNVSFVIDAEGIFFDVQTSIPLGLIINELICNAMKHAFPNKEQGEIKIAISKNESDNYLLNFSDNGIGISNNKKEAKTFGNELVKLLTMQLKGEIEVEVNKGTAYTISFEEMAA